VIDEDHGPVAEVLICLRRLNPAAAPRYEAGFGLDGYGVPRYEPLAVAVFGFEPETAGMDVGDPAIQEAVSPGTSDPGQVQAAGSTGVPASVGSATLNDVSVTSPEL